MGPRRSLGERGVAGGADLLAELRDAVSAVADPEYPDITIGQLGIFEFVREAEPGRYVIGLVPTVTSCPALDVIRRDVTAAAQAVLTEHSQPAAVEVKFLHTPAWSTSRIAPEARSLLAREYTVAVRTSAARTPPCANCGSTNLKLESAFGSTKCRSVYWCADCRNPVEVVGDFAFAAAPYGP